MNSEVNPSRLRRLRQLATLTAVLLVGLVLGVFADRLYLENARRTADPCLIGDWVALGGTDNEENIIRFNQDGTYDSTLFRKVEGKFTQVWQTNLEYRWIYRDMIEMYDPFNGWTKRNLVFEGDELRLLYDGTVWRLTRKKGL